MTLTLATSPADTADNGALSYVPLSRLILSPLNARQTVDAAEIGAMADSISTIGLLQNLIGLQHADTAPVEIVAGGKRLRALQLLAAQGFMPHPSTGLDFDRIPVRITAWAADAIEMAGAENAARTQPHPADEVRAYRAMRDRDFAPRTIALAFAQTEAHVKRRLALANLPDPILDALRADQITLDQAAAFTVARSEKQALDTLKAMQAPNANSWDWNAHGIRRKLTADLPGAGDRRLRFIGLDAYTAAGGTLTLDLFQDHSYVDDPALLVQLADEKLLAKATELQQAEGWSFHYIVNTESDLWGKVDVLARTEGQLTEADTDEYDRLAELAEADALDDDGQIKLDALQARLDGDWTDEDRARAGIAAWIGYDGTLGVRRGIVMKDQAPATAPADDDAEATTTSTAPQAEAGMSQSLRDDLRAIRLLALQAALLERSDLLLDLLAWQLPGDLTMWDAPLAVTTTRTQNTPAVTDGVNIPARLQQPDPSPTRNAVTPEAFAIFRAIPERDRMRSLMSALARSYARDTGLLSVSLAQTLRPNARAIWTPTAANFFNRCPAPYLNRLWAELVPADQEDAHFVFGAAQKKAKAQLLHRLFNDLDYREALKLSRAQTTAIDTWLPEDLRWPEDDSNDQDAAA
jgi:ParB family chromosome partitioning protein